MDVTSAIEALRKARDENASVAHAPISWFLVDQALAALDAAQGEAVAKVFVPGPLSQEVGMSIFPLPTGRGLPHGTKLFAAPQSPPAAVPSSGLRDSVLNSAKFRASCYALVGIVEGIAGLGRRWAADGERIKDTPEWVEFYNRIAAMRNGTAEAHPAPVSVPSKDLAWWAGSLLIQCQQADVQGELPECIDGSVMDKLAAALAANKENGND